MKLKYFLLLPVALLLVGCSPREKNLTYSYITTNSAPVQVVNKNAQAQLAEASESVGHSLQQKSEIQLATHPKFKLPPPQNPAAIGMAQQTSLNWTGPIEPLLEKIAAASHYQVRVLGKQPAIPAIVAIDANNVPLATILRDATFQVVKKANITLYPGTKTIELRYYPS